MHKHPELGQLVPEGESRDAIHIAVAPVVAGHPLKPGEHVTLIDGKAYRAMSSTPEPIGVVDSFLRKSVEQGQTFWLMLYPNTIQSLRHEWAHPAFPEEKEELVTSDSQAIAWITVFASSIKQTFESLMEAGDRYTHGDPTFDNSESYNNASCADWETFWNHYQHLRATTVENAGSAPFSCSC